MKYFVLLLIFAMCDLRGSIIFDYIYYSDNQYFDFTKSKWFNFY